MNKLSFGVELESEVKLPGSRVTEAGRITFTERGIYLGTGIGIKVLYDGKSIDNCLKFEGVVDADPLPKSKNEVYFNTTSNELIISQADGSLVRVPVGTYSEINLYEVPLQYRCITAGTGTTKECLLPDGLYPLDVYDRDTNCRIVIDIYRVSDTQFKISTDHAGANHYVICSKSKILVI